jgi:hypothetical protein
MRVLLAIDGSSPRRFSRVWPGVTSAARIGGAGCARARALLCADRANQTRPRVEATPAPP